nr:DUF4363 family protein [Clostridioides sp.]
MVIIIKSTVFAVVWTVLFLAFGVYITNSINEYTSDYQSELVKLEHFIDEDNWNKAKEEAEKISEEWDKKQKKWYKTLDHASFNLIGTHLNILKKCIVIEDKATSYEQIENIKSHISNIRGNVNFGLDYIF